MPFTTRSYQAQALRQTQITAWAQTCSVCQSRAVFNLILFLLICHVGQSSSKSREIRATRKQVVKAPESRPSWLSVRAPTRLVPIEPGLDTKPEPRVGFSRRNLLACPTFVEFDVDVLREELSRVGVGFRFVESQARRRTKSTVQCHHAEQQLGEIHCVVTALVFLLAWDESQLATVILDFFTPGGVHRPWFLPVVAKIQTITLAIPAPT